MRRRGLFASASASALTLIAGLMPADADAAGESTAPKPQRDFATYQPSANAARITPAEAPKIDGDVSDAIWAKAPLIDEFYQLEPNEKSPASERMEVRVLYDEDNLYFSFKMFDSEPGKINATIKSRDGAVGKDDFIRIYLDPYMSRRDGYIFEVNPLGSRTDGLIQNNNTFLYEWDTTWSAKAQIVSDGWQAEIAIPFRSISYDPAKGDWGFDLFRMIRRKNERIRWSQIKNSLPGVDVSKAGTLIGITDTAKGLGLDLQMYGTATYKHRWADPREDDTRFEPSGNAYYKITPALTGTLTFNTDFSDTPLDDRQINTGRFGLFFPETRDFFLQDAAVFEFGGNNLANDVNGQPFFSRNIGLVDGTPVDIIAGGKLSGNIGSLGVGALLVDTSGTETLDGQMLAAARITQPIFGESKIGIVMTHGDPTGITENTVAGVDFQFRNSSLIAGKTIKADFFYERSFSDTFEDDDSFGVALAFPNEPFGGRFQFKEVGENYYPALGFVNRPGIRYYDGNLYTVQRWGSDATLRWLEAGTWYNFVTDLNDNLQSRENGVWAGISLQSNDMMNSNIWNDYEKVDAPFNLPRGVVVPAGEYTWTAGNIYFETSPSRPVSVAGEIVCCSFFGGRRLSTFFYVNWRPDSTWDIALEHRFTNITLPTGDLEFQIWAGDLKINFTPDMQLLTQIQYDNISEGFGLSARYRWEFQPGSELFVSLGESAELLQGLNYRSDTTQLSVRLGHLMRF